MSVPYNPDRISRQDLVEQSVLYYIQNGLSGLGITPGYLEAFNTNLFENEALDKSYIAEGFNSTDGGRLWELGSNLRRTLYNLEYWIIGLNYSEGRNLANQVRGLVEQNLIIPILDFTQPQPYPVIDALESAEHPAKVERAVVGNPLPWQQYLWQVCVPVLDFDYP